ncbi:MAG: ferredoxin [Fimbriimonadaceae bacterium]|nr:ferredoxin [Chthonomonadaceae bacterium]MCO5297298.1 ferredoxin [Fimbriimonadaceae bacterium]
METDRQAQLTFHLTGRIDAPGVQPLQAGDLRPALFARFRDLTNLRYDFPLVLAPNEVLSLSELFDRALAGFPEDADRSQLVHHARAIELDVRTRVAGGAQGDLSELVQKSIARLVLERDEVFAKNAESLRAALGADGPVVDCDRAMPSRLFAHLWRAAHTRKGRALRAEVERLVLRLSEILRADFVRSEAGRSPANLKASIGSSFESAFDFDALSRTLARNAPVEALPEARRQRIESLLEVLRGQRFYPSSDGGAQPYEFVFESASAALEAYHDRLPHAIELARAMAIADLEVRGEYRESWHEPLFADFGANGLDPSDLDSFPDYLVCVNSGKMKAPENARLVEMLAMGLPMKIVIQTDDLLGGDRAGDEHLAFGLHNRHLVSTALSLSDVFVLQAGASSLPAMRNRLAKGIAAPGPALFSVYSGAGGSHGPIPPYLVAAAATESRAFPAFVYDPFGGGDWATRFRLDDNPQPELDWPVHRFSYEGADMQRVEEELAFTFLDFAACDLRFANHFARVDRERWNGTMMTAPDALARESKGLPDQVPYVMLVDGDDRLHKVLADQRLLREGRRCLGMWRSLQELGGIHNSHAQRLLEAERHAWEAQAIPSVESSEVVPASPEPATPEEPVEPVETPQTDDPYIETARCTSCNECTQVNAKMFAYNENKQAYIADPDAGTFRQLVEAAESCQVAIIHPGKPRNPDEPGLEELLERAKVFA